MGPVGLAEVLAAVAAKAAAAGAPFTNAKPRFVFIRCSSLAPRLGKPLTSADACKASSLASALGRCDMGH